jgi:hypothetical protein
MDSRQMKKHILAFALKRFADTARPQNNPAYILGLILDSDEVSDASIKRYNKILQEMVENAEDKLD